MYLPGEVVIAFKEAIKKTGYTDTIGKAFIHSSLLFELTPEQVEEYFKEKLWQIKL
jgi:hypothetical protein